MKRSLGSALVAAMLMGPVAVMVTPTTLQAQAASADEQRRQQEFNALAARARGSNDADANAAAAEAERLVTKEPWNYRRPATVVVEALLQSKRYEPAESLARAIILGAPTDWWLVNDMQKKRIEAYLGRGRNDDALAAAKGLYNFADFRQIKQAIDEVARVLQIVDPQDGAARARRFREQQQAWLTHAPQENDPLWPPVLADVKVDMSVFQEYLERPAHSNIYVAAMNRGLVLLLADKPEEAMAAFREASGLAANEQRKNEVAHAMARALRARDQCLAPANEHLKSEGLPTIGL